jgi:hypothetical protein
MHGNKPYLTPHDQEIEYQKKQKKSRCNPPFTETYRETETYCGSARKLEEKFVSVV